MNKEILVLTGLVFLLLGCTLSKPDFQDEQASYQFVKNWAENYFKENPYGKTGSNYYGNKTLLEVRKFNTVNFAHLPSELQNKFRFYEACLYDGTSDDEFSKRCKPQAHLIALSSNGNILENPSLNDLLKETTINIDESKIIEFSKVFIEIEFFKQYFNYVRAGNPIVVDVLFPESYAEINFVEDASFEGIENPANYSQYINQPEVIKTTDGTYVKLVSIWGGLLMEWNVRNQENQFSINTCQLISSHVGENYFPYPKKKNINCTSTIN